MIQMPNLVYKNMVKDYFLASLNGLYLGLAGKLKERRLALIGSKVEKT